MDSNFNESIFTIDEIVEIDKLLREALEKQFVGGTMAQEKCSTPGCNSELQNSEERTAKLCWHCKCERCGKLIPEDIRDKSLICRNCKDGKPALASMEAKKQVVEKKSEDLEVVTEKVELKKESIMYCNDCDDELEKEDEKYGLCDGCRCVMCNSSLEDSGVNNSNSHFCTDCQWKLADQARAAKEKGKELSIEAPEEGFKGFMKEAGVRAVAKQMNKQTRRLFVHMMTQHITGKSKANAARLAEQMLDSKAGEALCGFLLSYAMTEGPEVYENYTGKKLSETMKKRLQKLAFEVKHDGAAEAMSELMGFVFDQVNGENFAALKDYLGGDAEAEEKKEAKPVKAAKKAKVEKTEKVTEEVAVPA